MKFLTRRHRSESSVLETRKVRRQPAQLAKVRRAAEMLEFLEDRTLFAVTVTIAGSPTPTVNAGQIITYTINLRNNTTNVANNVVLTDVMPANTTFVGINQTGGPTFTAQLPNAGNGFTLTESIGQLNSSTGASFDLRVRVNPATPVNTVIQDTVNATDDTTINSSDIATTVVNTEADVGVTKSTTTTTAIAGTDVTYTLTITNNGPSNADNVTISDITPQFTTFVSETQSTGPTFTVTATPPVGQAGTFSASLATMAPGASASFIFTVHLVSSAPQGGTLFNTIRGTTTTFDPTQSNNFFTVSNPIDTRADLLIVSDSDKLNKIYEGTDTPYSVTIYNLGPSDAQNVSFVWTTPNFNPFVPVKGEPGVYYSNVNPVTLVSGPGFGISLPAAPPQRGNITGGLTTLPAGVATTYKMSVGIPDTQDMTQNSSVSSGTVDPDPSNNTHQDKVHVYDAPLVVDQAPDIQGNVGQPVSAVIQLYHDTNNWPGNSATGDYRIPGSGRLDIELADFTATIDWGDGTPASAGVISVDADGEYRVTGFHTYANAGIYPVHTVVQSEESTAISDAIAVVGTPLRGGSPVVGLTFNRNVTQTKQVATFFPGNAPSGTTFSATINWGDGTSSAGTMTANGNGSYNVTGTHKYTTSGNFTAIVTVHGSDNINNNINVPVTVVDTSVNATPINVAAQTNVAATNVAVATFTDPSGVQPVGTYTAIIDWGDGSPTDVGVISLSGSTYTVRGTHTWTSAGTYNMTVTISKPGAPDAIVNPVATVTDTPPLQAVNATPVNVNAVATVPATNVPVATFTDPGGPDVVGNYTATIDWGDGSGTTTGTITVNAGTFTVTGTHTWATPGTYNMTVTIQHLNSPPAVVNPIATVTAPGGVATTTPATINGIEGQTLTGVVVGSFTSTKTTAVTTDFKATINWGDGTAVSTGTIVKVGTGQFQVKGTHTYKKFGTFPVTVVVTPTGQSGVTINSTANIAAASLRGVSVAFSATKNSAFSNKFVASFYDNNTYATTASAYTAIINWGDGTASSNGTITYNSTTKRFDVRGSHTYTKASPIGGFKPVITVTKKNSTQLTKITSTATVT
jgi:uncharacterized repeat protein (TIGR01451 family)